MGYFGDLIGMPEKRMVEDGPVRLAMPREAAREIAIALIEAAADKTHSGLALDLPDSVRGLTITFDD